MLRIGTMCHSSCGGSARIALNSASELAKRGHKVHLFARTPPYLPLKVRGEISCHTLYNSQDRTEHPAYLRTYWPDFELDRMAELIIAVAEGQGLDILHIHYAVPFVFVARLVKDRLREKAPSIILTLHGTDIHRLADSGADGSALSRILGCCDALTTVSESHAQLFTRLSRWDSRPEVIPNFVDLSNFFPRSPAMTGPRPVILHISNFRRVKDPCGVVDIFDRLREKFKAVLWLVGDGEEMGRVRALVEDRGLQGDVVFFGLLPDVSGIARNADLLVMSSVYESFCLTVLEAMACGVPVLAPHVGGLPEVVVHGKTGFLYPPDDYAAAADFASRLLSGQGLYSQASKEAVLRARNFDQGKIVDLYERLYYRVRGEYCRAATG